MNKPLPRVSKKGYRLLGSGAQVLALHGYTGSPYDLRPLANGLNADGFSVRAPLLLGHGTKPKDLLGVTAEDWLLEVKAELKALDEKKPIILAGLSMGALIALILARSNKNIAALILISPALKLNLSGELMIAAATLGLIPKNIALKKMSGASDINDPVGKAKCPSYKSMPISGLLQFEKLRTRAKAALPSIACPVFAAFAKHDGAIDVDSCRRLLLDQARAKIISKTYLHSKHVLPLDFDRDALCQDVLSFLHQTI